MLKRYRNVVEVVRRLQPEEPVWCFSPETVTAQAREAIAAFPGDVLYAVKCNHDEHFLRALYKGGIRHFDTASLGEIALVRSMFPDAHAYFMHPVKSPEAITAAASRFGVRHFVVDHPAELQKVLENTAGLSPVIVVRIATARGAAVYDLGGKFGCELPVAAQLLQAARASGCRTGVSFHVGSQCLTPAPYAAALAQVKELLKLAPGPLDLIDIGGGFPARYEGVDPPAFGDYAKAVTGALALMDIGSGCRLACEPGRMLVAGGANLVTRVELRRDASLHINDGVFGSLAELRFPGINLPMAVVDRHGEPREGAPAFFSLFGPTCDTVDALPGPFFLPQDVADGDYLIFGMIGAYSMCTRTRFNGFYSGEMLEVASIDLPDCGVPLEVRERLRA